VITDPAPKEVGDNVGGEHDAENLKPLLEGEADHSSEENGKEDKKAELGRGGNGGHNSTKSYLRVNRHGRSFVKNPKEDHEMRVSAKQSEIVK
jgi:hypothetical protein